MSWSHLCTQPPGEPDRDLWGIDLDGSDEACDETTTKVSIQRAVWTGRVLRSSFGFVPIKARFRTGSKSPGEGAGRGSSSASGETWTFLPVLQRSFHLRPPCAGGRGGGGLIHWMFLGCRAGTSGQAKGKDRHERVQLDDWIQQASNQKLKNWKPRVTKSSAGGRAQASPAIPAPREQCGRPPPPQWVARPRAGDDEPHGGRRTMSCLPVRHDSDR